HRLQLFIFMFYAISFVPRKYFIIFMKMDFLQDSQPKCKRMRTNPTKKWNLDAEKSLVEYLMANQVNSAGLLQAFCGRNKSGSGLEAYPI
ncbi:hypothetical protein DOY81_011661, partial [Sarcophaga bullata]